ncbi:uncharacterized protein LOC120183082 [Hibiscus syriacus]|uniref:uncharacterized protein LOC120183082 n=1 Tax=Hibiscus syriacus TaxID=106335 RepID=UPI001924A06A|nr:uncharacterized protein LOC120183082 [Hibiscus syriacus]
MRQRQQLHRPLQQELQRPLKDENRVNLVGSLAESRTDSDESTLSRPDLACSSAPYPPEISSLTNLDRLMKSVTHLVPAQCFSEAKMIGWRTHEVNLRPYFCLGDLWECFSEWSVYGVGVPLLLNGSDSVKQYYVPSLSGIQLYVDPNRLRRASEDSDVESSIVASNAGSSDCETDRRVKGDVDGAWGKHNSRGISKPPTSSLMMKWRLATRPGFWILNTLNKNSHIIGNLYMTRFRVLHLNFQISGCTGAVIYCQQVGSQWLGTQYTEYLWVQPYKTWMHHS